VWIISDGRNCGVSRLIGRLLVEARKKSEKKKKKKKTLEDSDDDDDDDDWQTVRHSDPVFIGVSHWGSLKRKRLLYGISVSRSVL